MYFILVHVLNKNGKALGMCKPQKARKLLQNQKAKVISKIPFAIQLLYGSSGYTQETDLGIDLGAKYVGLAAQTQNKVILKGEIELRDDVKGLLESRKTYRRSRRNRKTRYRRCKFKYKTIRKYSIQKHKWLKRKESLESSRKEGWLPPSILSRIDNTFFWIDKYCSLLPKCKLHIEVGKFDIAKMINPEIEGKDYQEGEAFGYHDVRYFVFARDHYTCQVCGKKKDKILNTHHIVYRSHGGSNRAANLITVCTDCHTYENHQEGAILWQWMHEGKKVKGYKEGTFMNVFRHYVFGKYPNARITYGSETTPRRKSLELDKSHSNDAIAITGINKIEHMAKETFKIKQFRKKKRSLHEATARKGRKQKNITSKRNEKNTKQVNEFYLNDQVEVFGVVGFITGFTGKTGAYVKDINDNYITVPNKNYKQVGLNSLKLLRHYNNWQYVTKWQSL